LSRFNWAIFLGLVCCLPALVFGQSEPSKHLYAVEYSYEEGITLHRFLHHKWNVFLGGRLASNESSSGGHSSQPSDIDLFGFYLDEDEEHTITGYQMHFGIGRSLFREGHFGLTGRLCLQHKWYEYRRQYTKTDTETLAQAKRIETGHNNTTTAYLSLRPAYDITPRITLLLEFGINFQHYRSTSDNRSEDPENLSWYGNGSSRSSDRSNHVNLFGSNSVNSIKFMFRF